MAHTVEKGKPDPLGDIVDRVLIGTERFIIYAVAQDIVPDPGAEASGKRGAGASQPNTTWLRTILPDDYACARDLRRNLSGIALEMANVCDVVDSLCRAGSLDHASSASLRRRATEIMARAMEMALEGNEVQAKKLLHQVQTDVTTLRDSKNRMRYVLANVITLLGLLVLWALLRSSEMGAGLTVGVAGDGGSRAHVFDILALGAIGSFFAISATLSTVRVSHSVTWPEMLYAGAVRVPIGVIAAAVVILLISGGWMLSAIDGEALRWSFLLFGFLAGFSELFVPNALRQVEAAAPVGGAAKPA